MKDNLIKDVLKLFNDLLVNNISDSQNLQKSIIEKIEEIKNKLNTNALDREIVIKLSQTIEELIKSKEFKQSKDLKIFEEFKNYLEKKK
tara:strand:+ start:1786 stop:2052 length:267 start_codon:yes stop_codon:yes gene_type:complete